MDFSTTLSISTVVILLQPVQAADRCLARTAIGMENGRISDSSVTSSSSYPNYLPKNGRLHRPGCWIPQSSDIDPWIQVDLGLVENITKIATQGGFNILNQWTKTYTLAYSLDGKNFVPYQNNKILVANADNNAVVGNVLLPPINARYIRLHPKDKEGQACTKMELYTGQCSEVNYYLAEDKQSCDKTCQSQDQLCLDIDHGFTEVNTRKIVEKLVKKSCGISNDKFDNFDNNDANPIYVEEEYNGALANKCTGWKNVDEKTLFCKSAPGSAHVRRVCPCNQVKHVRICSEAGGYLECTNGKAIKVVGANYGRTEYKVCPHPKISTTECRDKVSFNFIRGKCDGKTYCDIWSSQEIFGSDPCIGTNKYLQVDYECTGEIIKPVAKNETRCSKPLGMEDGLILESDITASSHQTEMKPHYGRLNNVFQGSWTALIEDLNQYFQVNFKRRVNITKVSTQGRFTENEWVKEYSLSYSQADGFGFRTYTRSERKVVFKANTDRHTVVTNTLSPPIRAEFIRIHPLAWFGAISLRAEFYGCKAPCVWGQCDLCNSAPTFPGVDQKSLIGHVMVTFQAVDELVCQLFCLRNEFCLSFNLGPKIGTMRSCELSDSDHIRNPDDLVSRDGYKYYGKKNPCSINPCRNNGSCHPNFMEGTYKCLCQPTYKGPSCEIESNECAEKTHNCHPGADCIPTKDSYNCTCRKGYTGDGFSCYAPETCTEILEKNPSSPSGAYYLNQKGGDPQLGYCHMEELPGCSGRGWTMVMKINGSKNTFKYSSEHWSSRKSHNAEGGAKGLDVKEETKTHVFWSAPLTRLCLGMLESGETNWLEISHVHWQTMQTGVLPSLQQIFKGESYLPTIAGRTGWKSLISGSSLQLNCNREGYNVKDDRNYVKTRFGLIANDQKSCINSESFIGLGLSYYGCGNYVNENKNNADNGVVSIKPFCYVLLK